MPAIASTRVVLSRRSAAVTSAVAPQPVAASRPGRASPMGRPATATIAFPTASHRRGAIPRGIREAVSARRRRRVQPDRPLVSVLRGFAIARAVVYWRAEALFHRVTRNILSATAYAEKCATHSSTVTVIQIHIAARRFCTELAPTWRCARVHGEAELGGWAAVRQAARNHFRTWGGRGRRWDFAGYAGGGHTDTMP